MHRDFALKTWRRGAASAALSPWLLAAALLHHVTAPLAAQPRTLDDFESLEGWAAFHSDGAEARIASGPGRTGRALVLEFDLSRAFGYALARKELPLGLPPDFQFSFDLRAETAVNNFEFKVQDAQGNVWWRRTLDYHYPSEWTRVHLRRRHLSFAWGPAPGAPLRDVQSLDFVVATGAGGTGRLFIDNLRFEPVDPAAAEHARAVVSFSSADAAGEPSIDPSGTVVAGWRSAAPAGGGESWLAVDFGYTRELGGLVLDWEPGAFAPAYEVLLSDDGASWEVAARVLSGNGGRDYLFLSERQGRWLKLVAKPRDGGGAIGLARLEVKGSEFGASENAFLAAVAADQPRGLFPRYLCGEQSYWTVVGSPGDVSEALINEDGAIEVDQLRFSLEPFLHLDGRLVTWNDVVPRQSLEKGYLPIPSVEWRSGDVALTITALAAGDAGSDSHLLATYRVESRGPPSKGRLFVAMRPFQVNPPWQSLQHPAGWARLSRIALEDKVVVVGDRAVIPLDAPSGFGATAFESGEITEHLREGRLPVATEVSDPAGMASAAFAYDFDLAAGGVEEFRVVVPFHDRAGAPGPHLPRAAADAWAAAAHDATRRTWESMLDRFSVRLPPNAQPIIDTIKSNLAYIFINQDGPRIQPGSRNYERSWIRDGSLTSTAMLELGLFEEVRAFADWYAQFQLPSGHIPCVVDQRGADPTNEHDSHGQMIFLIRQVHHFTRDDTWLRGKWDTVVKTVRYIQSLRAQRKTDLYRHGTPEQQACYGLVPESISHEGYSAKPMHSYWDGFFILRGLKDAVEIAALLGEKETEAEFAAERDDFARDLYASMRRAIQNTGIDFIPGCVELGDFDPTSTTVGLCPANELGRIPEPELHHTFDRYFERFLQRREGALEWLDYTPYENRVIASFVYLGQRERAHAALDWFMAQRRPAGWNHWAEVVFRDPRLPRMIPPALK